MFRRRLYVDETCGGHEPRGCEVARQLGRVGRDPKTEEQDVWGWPQEVDSLSARAAVATGFRLQGQGRPVHTGSGVSDVTSGTARDSTLATGMYFLTLKRFTAADC